MTILISNDHPTLLLKSKIQEVSSRFFNENGFSYFQYLRCYADGSIGLLTNNTGAMEYFSQVDNSPVVFSSFEDEQKNKPNYWFLWDEALPEEPVELVRKKFKIHNGLTWVRRSKNYYDMIAVGLPTEQSNAGTFYFNKLKVIEDFIFSFEKDNKDLIATMTRSPIALPPAHRDLNYDKLCLKNGRIVIPGRGQETYLTSQEITCLRLYFRGMSCKEIGILLDISMRTVETYLFRIKQRTGFYSLSHLERFL